MALDFDGGALEIQPVPFKFVRAVNESTPNQLTDIAEAQRRFLRQV